MGIVCTHQPAGFNTQPPEGGWTDTKYTAAITPNVSTHSRLKAAGIAGEIQVNKSKFQHTAA